MIRRKYRKVVLYWWLDVPYGLIFAEKRWLEVYPFCGGFPPTMAITTETTETAVTKTTDSATAVTKTAETDVCATIPGQKPIGYCASYTGQKDYPILLNHRHFHPILVYPCWVSVTNLNNCLWYIRFYALHESVFIFRYPVNSSLSFWELCVSLYGPKVI